jgi:hypothetical protein
MKIHIPTTQERKTADITDPGQAIAEQILQLADGMVAAVEMGIPTTGYETQIYTYIQWSASSGVHDVTRKVLHATGRAVEIFQRELPETDLVSSLIPRMEMMRELLPDLPPVNVGRSFATMLS